MTVQLEIWQLISLLLTMLGMIFGSWKVVAASMGKRVDQASAKAEQAERALLRHLACLPLEYVRRDDCIRKQTVIEAKLDGLADKLDDIREVHHG